MRLKLFVLLTMAIVILPIIDCKAEWSFLNTREELEYYSRDPAVIIVASPGRSGSTMLFYQLCYYNPAEKGYGLLKTHLLPPDAGFLGKCVFIFSNPDKASESALYITLKEQGFFSEHFQHVETSDKSWFADYRESQTLEQNLLSYDALGVGKHLKAWFHDYTDPSSPETAQIIAVKYENLWDAEVLEALKEFLGYPYLGLPEQIVRGGGHDDLPIFHDFKQAYNLGTEDHPCYAAYDEARALWEQAPPIQYLRIKDKEQL